MAVLVRNKSDANKVVSHLNNCGIPAYGVAIGGLGAAPEVLSYVYIFSI